jgi:small subunit ribosomal protein S6
LSALLTGITRFYVNSPSKTLSVRSFRENRTIPWKGEFPNVKRNYEIAVVMPIGLNEEEYKTLEQKVGGWISESGGQINGSNHWGRRRLAYQIGQNREGYYVFLKAHMESGYLGELHRKMNIEPAVLRFLVVREDE